MAFFVNTAFEVWTDFEKGTSASFLNELIRKQLQFLIVSYSYYRAQKRILCLNAIAIEIKKNANFDK